MCGQDYPDVALSYSLAGILVRIDEDLVVGLVRTDVVVLLHGAPHGPVQVLEQECRFLEETVRRLLVKIEPVFGKVVHDALYGHRVEVAQLGDARDERAVETGVLYRSLRGPRADQTVSGLYGADMEHFLDELWRYHDVADHVTHSVEDCLLPISCPVRIDVLLDRLHLEVHVPLGAVVAAGLALCRLAFPFGLPFFFGLGFRRRCLLAFRLVLDHLGEAAHLALRFRKAGVAVFQQGLQVGYGLAHALHGCAKFGNGRIEVGHGHVQLEVDRIGGLQLLLEHLYDHILSHIQNEVSNLIYKYRHFYSDMQI